MLAHHASKPHPAAPGALRGLHHNFQGAVLLGEGGQQGGRINVQRWAAAAHALGSGSTGPCTACACQKKEHAQPAGLSGGVPAGAHVKLPGAPACSGRVGDQPGGGVGSHACCSKWLKRCHSYSRLPPKAPDHSDSSAAAAHPPAAPPSKTGRTRRGRRPPPPPPWPLTPPPRCPPPQHGSDTAATCAAQGGGRLPRVGPTPNGQPNQQPASQRKQARQATPSSPAPAAAAVCPNAGQLQQAQRAAHSSGSTRSPSSWNVRLADSCARLTLTTGVAHDSNPIPARRWGRGEGEGCRWGQDMPR